MRIFKCVILVMWNKIELFVPRRGRDTRFDCDWSSDVCSSDLLFGRLKTKSARFEDAFWSGRPLDELHRKLGDKGDHPMARVFSAGMTEWQRAKDVGRTEGLVAGTKDRIDKVMNVVVARELEGAERNLGVLSPPSRSSGFSDRKSDV